MKWTSPNGELHPCMGVLISGPASVYYEISGVVNGKQIEWEPGAIWPFGWVSRSVCGTKRGHVE